VNPSGRRRGPPREAREASCGGSAGSVWRVDERRDALQEASTEEMPREEMAATWADMSAWSGPWPAARREAPAESAPGSLRTRVKAAARYSSRVAQAENAGKVAEAGRVDTVGRREERRVSRGRGG
jgi:hypothetical protein